MVKGTGELVRGLLFLTRLVKRPIGEGNIEQRLERGKRTKQRKNAKAERNELYAVF